MPANHTESLVLRRADLQDSGFVWQWRNDPATQQNSLNGDAVSWNNHHRWFAAKIVDPETAIYVLEHRSFGPVAQARYEKRDPKSAEVHVTVSPQARGQGVGTRMLRESAMDAMQSLGVSEVVAIVALDNAGSLRAFDKSGYTLSGPREIAGKRYVELILTSQTMERA